ncbi:response regulator transcription factor [Phocicoccus pinnipedialis]|uniref:Transcriptional regulatory protein SrrA n=1 Tax=Phocicoccus pinnipedialis TaxID=110845 RepID=A0A6V7RFE8_9BACL|nr:response regulator transcription factor [Jeotgalicoccus pinnipedialis]MBP1939351.1 two-component system response regulator ResD [Jeotgalicoccus pinnipedialis]CAD2075739.1 Transcriptional regulatory protein SrrA [Jeotgalicoccus pinnipedialis]
MNKQRILVVDDEERIRKLVVLYLETDLFEIVEADNGDDALELALNESFDLVILDIMMPGLNGIEVTKQIRTHKSTPIILLTAKGEEADVLEGFEAGADDYVTKPFSPREVLQRAKAILKRSSETAYLKFDSTNRDIIVFEHLEIDNDAHKVTANGELVNLTPKEYDLLLFLAMSPEKVFDRKELLKEVWNYEFYGDLRTVDTHIKRLREKLNDVSPEASLMIQTVWGIGYKFEENPE